MNTVIKGTKTIAEFKQVREAMENLARLTEDNQYILLSNAYDLYKEQCRQ